MPKTKQPRKENVFQDGPYLQAALLCQNVMEEKSGVKSVIRIVDRITAQVTGGPDAPLDALPPYKGSFQMLLKLKTGKRPGKHELRIEMVDPSGAARQTSTQTFKLEEGPNRGMDFTINFQLELDREGIYWFDLYLDEILVTRVPLELIYVIQRVGKPQSPERVQ